MSATLDKTTRSTSRRTTSQRASEATTHLRQVLELDDLKILSTALAEVAAKEAQNNAAFAEQIRNVYAEILAANPTKSTVTKKSSEPAKLIPIGNIEDETVSPYGELNPRIILKLYGAEQFPTALGEYTLVSLKEAAELIIQQHPGTKPKSKSKKDDVIAYIIQHVTADNANN